MAELFEQLLAFKWREVEFPVTKMKVSLAHDLVEHKYWGRDGARVEMVGLAPIRFSATIPMINGIVPGKNERWIVLYPVTMRKLLAAFADKTEGFLQHPELGLVRVKPERIEFDWSGDKRGGCECEVSWVETLPEDGSQDVFEPSPVQDIGLGSQDLDASENDLRLLIPTFPKFNASWTDLARSIQSIGDTVTLLSNTTAGKINSIVYRVEQVEDSIDRAKSALTWQTTNTLERIKAAAHDLQSKLLREESKIVALFEVKNDTTVAGICAQLPDAKLGDLVRLNPSLMRNAIVPRGRVIRYYRARAA